MGGHRARRLDPTRVGSHWLVLAIATWLAVAYGTRWAEAEARPLAPGPLGRPSPESCPAHQDVWPPRSNTRRSSATPCCKRLWRRGYLWACVWLRPTPGPDFRTRLRQADSQGYCAQQCSEIENRMSVRI